MRYLLKNIYRVRSNILHFSRKKIEENCNIHIALMPRNFLLFLREKIVNILKIDLKFSTDFLEELCTTDGVYKQVLTEVKHQSGANSQHDNSYPASQQASKPASQQASKPASQQASQQASKPASQQASKPASLQASKPASQQASKSASQQDAVQQ